MGKQTTWAMRWLKLGYDHPETMPVLCNALRKQGFSNVLAVFTKIKTKGYKFSERDINGYGYVLLKQEKHQQALAIFKQQVAMYPQSANPYDSYAEAAESAGERQLAIDNYKHSFQLDTANISISYHIKALENATFTADKLFAFTGRFNKGDNTGAFLKFAVKGNRLILTQSVGWK